MRSRTWDWALDSGCWSATRFLFLPRGDICGIPDGGTCCVNSDTSGSNPTPSQDRTVIYSPPHTHTHPLFSPPPLAPRPSLKPQGAVSSFLGSFPQTLPRKGKRVVKVVLGLQRQERTGRAVAWRRGGRVRVGGVQTETGKGTCPQNGPQNSYQSQATSVYQV